MLSTIASTKPRECCFSLTNRHLAPEGTNKDDGSVRGRFLIKNRYRCKNYLTHVNCPQFVDVEGAKCDVCIRAGEL